MKEIKFAENLKTLRLGKNMNQTELATLLGVDRRTISVWENGKCQPSFEMLAKLCEIFDESFDELLS